VLNLKCYQFPIVEDVEFNHGSYLTLFGEIDELGRYTDSLDFLFDGQVIHLDVDDKQGIEVNGC
jgi:hypothetical protein